MEIAFLVWTFGKIKDRLTSSVRGKSPRGECRLGDGGGARCRRWSRPRPALVKLRVGEGARPDTASPIKLLHVRVDGRADHQVREHVRTVSVHALIAVGVNADGGRDVLGLDVAR